MSISDTDESELAAVMERTLNEFSDDDEDAPPAPAPVDNGPDPVGLVAKAMVQAIIDSRPEVLEAARVRGAVVILVAPKGWPDAVASAWRSVVLGRPEPAPREDTYYSRREREELERDQPLGLDFDGVQGKGWQERDNLTKALRTGRGVLIRVDALGVVTPALRAAADVTVTVDAPTPGIISAVAETLGEGAAIPVAPDVAAAMKPDHLLACLRPGQSAASYLGRLARVAAETIPAASKSDAASWTLDRLHGNEEVRIWGKALARDMRAYVAGELEWADVAPGVLLAGPPGCGKTVTAAAIAAECGVRLISTSYSEWQSAGREGHLGELTKCLRSVFQRARLAAPCILFIDEIDSVRGRTESTVSGRGNDEWWTAITNALLEEMDGITTKPGVLFIAASNHPNKVDPALRRSGRLDRMICLSTPDGSAIEAIMREHLGDHLSGVDLTPAADAAMGGSGADIASWVREARQAARHAGRAMTVGDLTGAISPPPSAAMPESRRRRTAYHEAGHAACVALISPGSLGFVSIRAGAAGPASLGGTGILSSAHFGSTAADVAGLLVRLMGGRAAELLACGDCDGGSGGSPDSDLARATLVAASAELAWGLGPRLSWICDPDPATLGHVLAVHRDVSARVEQRLSNALVSATALLTANRAALDALAAALLERNTLTGEAAEEIVRSANYPKKPRKNAPSDV